MANSYHDEVLADAPVACYPLSDPSGYAFITDTAVIAGPNTIRRGDIFGTPTYGQTGPIPGVTAMLIDAAGDYAKSTDYLNGQYSFPGGSITLEAWVKKSSVPGGSDPMQIWGLHNPPGATASAAGIRIDTAGHAQGYAYDTAGRTVTGTTNVCNGAWHHLAVVIPSSGTMRLYVDGVEEGTPVSFGSLWGASVQYVVVGSYLTGGAPVQSAEPVGVTIGWVALYQTALSASRIAAHAAATTVQILGYCSGGQGENTIPETGVHFSGPFQPTADGLLTRIVALVGDANGGYLDSDTSNSGLAVYDDNGVNEPYFRLAESYTAVTVPGAGSGRVMAWRTYTLPTPIVAQAVKKYHFAVLPKNVSPGGSYVCYGVNQSAPSPLIVRYNNAYGTTFPNPFSLGGWSSIGWFYSIYATLEPIPPTLGKIGMFDLNLRKYGWF